MKKKIILVIGIGLLLIGIMYVSLLLFVEYHKNEFQVPVIMYHDVVLDEYFQDKPDTISVSTFEKQLQYLKENNYKTLTLDEVTPTLTCEGQT